MTQAIQTRFLGPTNYRGSRIKAWCDRGSITIPCESAGSLDPHIEAAKALIAKFNQEDVARWGEKAVEPGWGWNSPFVRGTLPNGDEAFVFVTK